MFGYIICAKICSELTDTYFVLHSTKYGQDVVHECLFHSLKKENKQGENKEERKIKKTINDVTDTYLSYIPQNMVRKLYMNFDECGFFFHF